MSAVPSPEYDDAPPHRVFLRQPIRVPLELIALRYGVPENLPGRCTDISEAGVGAVVSGELAVGQQVAIELRLPDLGIPVRARALVRYQSRLHCGLEFSGLSLEQREMIRYWVYRSTSEPIAFSQSEESSGATKTAEVEEPAPAAWPRLAVKTWRSIRIGRRRLYALIAAALILSALGWWEWERSWSELEGRAKHAESGLRVAPETMEKRIITKVDPVYPETAKRAGTEGLVVFDAVIAKDGSVKSLRPVSGVGDLVQSASSAVRLWRFEPYLFSGKPVEVETTIAVEFRLN
jgi:TonB family protein